MAILLAPPPQTKVIRRARSELSPPGTWHLLKDGRERVLLCGDFINHLHNVDVATLAQIPAADLCVKCWMFEKLENGESMRTDQANNTTGAGLRLGT